MNRFDCARAAAAVATVALVVLGVSTPKANAQVSIDVGAEPTCPYGYYDYAPYACAPYGYYGPEWFAGGVFIGVGPWFHGPAGFHGHVDNRFDLHHGYGGPLPNRGDHPDPARRFDRIDHFNGNEMRDGHGHAVGARR
jgi:hypothetical protein